MTKKQVQYPSVQGVVQVPAPVVVPTFFECDSVQKFPRRWAQQPPSFASIVMDPSLFIVPSAFLDGSRQAQKFPRRWAQQPHSYVGPVMVIPVVASTRRRFAWVT